MSVSSRIAYHLDELAVARDPSFEEHIMPSVLPSDRAILDVGCGIGQTLVGLNLDTERLLVGIDIEQESLVYGKQQFDSVNYANSPAEALPFAENTFDLVISRVALPYTNIPQALAEMHRVLKPGGRVWITLHPQRKTVAQMLLALKEMRWKDVAFRAYILANGLSFHLFGWLFAFPANNKTESFQTSKSISKALSASGFSDLTILRNRHFLVTSTKPLAS